jgi:hypothetical protein
MPGSEALSAEKADAFFLEGTGSDDGDSAHGRQGVGLGAGPSRDSR